MAASAYGPLTRKLLVRPLLYLTTRFKLFVLQSKRVSSREEHFEVAMGVGFTEILDLDACNAFGDAVNMAFKLGEDVAKGNEILITENVKSAMQGVNNFPFRMEDSRSVELSGIEIPHFNVEYDEWAAEAMIEAMETEKAKSGSSPRRGKRLD